MAVVGGSTCPDGAPVVAVPIDLPLAEVPAARVLRWTWHWEDPELASCPSA